MHASAHPEMKNKISHMIRKSELMIYHNDTTHFGLEELEMEKWTEFSYGTSRAHARMIDGWFTKAKWLLSSSKVIQ